MRNTLDDIKVNQGILLSEKNVHLKSINLQDYEFKIFSQGGEDGIIQFLTNSIDINNKTFIEFGVEDFSESNCRFLIIKDNRWRGFVVDSSKKNIQKLKNYDFFWKNNLNANNNFITKENIENILIESGFDKDLGILSIDLDGNDYHILEKINFFKPRILIAEYNSLFGDERKITIPYNENFNMTNAHYSNLFWGASLPALTYLANKKGLELVGTSSSGVNAFFVRKDLLNEKIKSVSVKSAFTKSVFRISRNKDYDLNFLSYNDSQKLIRGLKVLNVETMQIEKF